MAWIKVPRVMVDHRKHQSRQICLHLDTNTIDLQELHVLDQVRITPNLDLNTENVVGVKEVVESVPLALKRLLATTPNTSH